MNVIEFNNVWKKFNKGEKIFSLRDAIPAFFRKAINGKNGGLEDKEFWALQNVSFEIKKGDVVGIIGPNGAGKSTTLKLLSGILTPNKGKMNINGRLSALIEVTAGFHPELTGRENVYLNGTILGMRRKEIDAKFDEIVDFSGVEEFIDTPVKRYSSGMYARLGFSVAAHMDPDILLVDEVLAVGDITFQAKCAQKMRNLLNSGSTIVLVSHNLPLIQNMCKRTILFNKGKILMDAEPDKVIPYYQNLVYKKEEEEIKKKTNSEDFKIRIKEESLVKISEVCLYGEYNKQKEVFSIGETITIKVNYKTHEKIENPVFSLEIIRADGVLCCASNTKNIGFNLKSIRRDGRISIDLGKLNLSSGIYVAKLSIWDKEMVHPYVVRRKDIFRVEAAGLNENSNAVFLPQVIWKTS